MKPLEEITEEITLEQEIKDLLLRLKNTIDIVHILEPDNNFSPVLYFPSKNFVLNFGNKVVKSYKDYDDWNAEQDNKHKFKEITRKINPIYKEFSGTQEDFIRLLDVQKIDSDTNTDCHISICEFLPGDTLYTSTLTGAATIEHYLSAVAQIARTQTLGLVNKDKLWLEDVVKKTENPIPPNYFLNRFGIALAQLIRYGGLNIEDSVQKEMLDHWNTLIASKLIESHNKGRVGFYCDGNPGNYILNHNNSVIGIDLERKSITPYTLDLASLLYFGLTKDGKGYFTEKELTKIIDRFLLERELAGSLISGSKEKVKSIVSYIDERRKNHYNNLSVNNEGNTSEDFFRFFCNGNVEEAKKYRDEFLVELEDHKNQRIFEWLGYKSKFRSIAKALKEKGVIVEGGLIEQVANEQLKHLKELLLYFEQLKNDTNKEKTFTSAASMLYNIFQKLENDNYFRGDPTISLHIQHRNH